MKHLYILILFLALFAQNTFSQFGGNERRMLKNANGFYEKQKYSEALPLYLKLDEDIDDTEITYRIGICYLNTAFEKINAIPYLESLLYLENAEIPIDVPYHLGQLYHFMYRFNDALIQYNAYLKKLNERATDNLDKIRDTERLIGISKNAKRITSKPYKAEVEILGSPINTMESQYMPMITADEELMVFMQTTGIGKSNDPITRMMISRREGTRYWGVPKELKVEENKEFEGLDIRLAGLSPDGQIIYINIGKGLAQDIYQGQINETEIVNVSKLNKHINTPFYEGRVSISSDGSYLYFASDRPGGFGGSDIYRSELNRRGEWTAPENLGERVNSLYNENSPFLHPDNKTLFFSSEGHETIGGKDIFRTKYEGDLWGEVENLGFPNSTKDDLYFVLNASGQVGYFSSSKNNVYNKHSIYKVNFKDPIPLTLVKGTILGGNPLKPINASIKVYDTETSSSVKYIYNPDPETGKYLMIFPPAKQYELLISSEDYLPQLINIHVPYQTYFYELHQQIVLKPIQVLDNDIGEEITVNNMFYDLYRTAAADSILLSDLPKQPKYYDHLLELVENIIETTDTMRINYTQPELDAIQDQKKIDDLLGMIEEAIETTDPITLSILDANAKQEDKIKEKHFYTNGDKAKSLQETIIGEDTILTAKPLETNRYRSPLEVIPAKMKRVAPKVPTSYKNSKPEERNYIKHFVIYYPVNEAQISDTDKVLLQSIAELLVDNHMVAAEVYGYTDALGEKGYNLSLSRKRAQNVLQFLVDNKVESKKLISKGFGDVEAEKASDDLEQQIYRKVEINIFELKQKQLE